MRERFVREAQAAAAIDSDHVVEIVTAGVDEESGAPYIAMELLKGEELADAVERRGRLPLGEVREIFSQIGHALENAHSQGIVHRDLKPENIFLAQARRRAQPFTAKLLDFGVAKWLTHGNPALGTQPVGSPLFMAPEQTDSLGNICPATDVWALGLLAFYLLTGKCYWLGAEHASVPVLLREVCIDPIIPASTRARALGVAAHIPKGFDAWFLRCVARDIGERYEEGGAAVEAFLEAVPFEAIASESERPLSPLSLGPTSLRPASVYASMRPPDSVIDLVGRAPTDVAPGSDREGVSRSSRAPALDGLVDVTGDSFHPGLFNIVIGSQPPTEGLDQGLQEPSFDRSHVAPIFDSLPDSRLTPPGLAHELIESEKGRAAPWFRRHRVAAGFALAAALAGAAIGGLTGWRTHPQAQTTSAQVAEVPPDEGHASEAPPAKPAASTSIVSNAAPKAEPDIDDPSCPKGMVLEPPSASADAREAFCVDRTEVTVAAYAKCAGAGACAAASDAIDYPDMRDDARDMLHELCNGPAGRNDHPMNCIDWQSADGYCRARNARLPTEAEWVVASSDAIGSHGEKKAEANLCGDECADWGVLRGFFFKTDYAHSDSFSGTAPVGSFADHANPRHVDDLDGNVAEWTADRGGAPSTEKRVVRGAAFFRYVSDPLAEARAEIPEAAKSHLVGFRCVSATRSPSQETRTVGP